MKETNYSESNRKPYFMQPSEIHEGLFTVGYRREDGTIDLGQTALDEVEAKDRVDKFNRRAMSLLGADSVGVRTRAFWGDPIAQNYIESVYGPTYKP